MDLLQRGLLAALGALTLFLTLVRFSLGYWKRRGILHAKPKFLWGNLQAVVRGKRHLHEELQSIYECFKGRAPFVGCYALLRPCVLVLDLELVRNVLQSDAGYFTSRGLYHNVAGEPLSGNLLQLDGHKWRALHAASSGGVFTPSNMLKLLPRLLQLSQSLQLQLGQQQQPRQLNVTQLVDGYNVEVIAALTYGLSGDQSEFRVMTHSYWQQWSLRRAYLALEFPLLARLLQYRSYAQHATDYFYKLAQTQLQQQRTAAARQQNFLQLYAQLEDREQGDALSEAQIAAQAFGFILAGLAPLNATLGFALYELALQPELQQRVRQEMQQALRQHEGELTAECLKQLVYTKQVLYETLRLHTPYPLLLRRATKEFELQHSVFVIARGNNVVIPTAAIHRDPEWYPQPLRFDPDRFEAQAVRTRPAMAFLPFGEGLRGCIAKQLAEQQLLVGLVALLQHHKYAPCADTQIPMQYDNAKVLLTPRQDIRLCVEHVES
ncbi:hypothetical protein KR222_004325 [Zaprionus bogoriensis]|nr:hypothetical protein KR222_004325 [Zaprionus bogoriensis]